MDYHDFLRPKRILMTSDAAGGVWTYSLELARALSGYGIEVFLATMGPPLNPGQRSEAGRISNLKIMESRFKLEWMENPWEDVEKAGFWLLELEDRINPDVIHLNGYAHGALPFRSPKLVVGHSCVASWWEAVKRSPPPPSWDRYRREVAQGIAAADMVAAPTEAMFWLLVKHYGSIDCGRVIYNGRDPKAFKPGNKQPFILSAGRLWDEAKNFSAVDRIASRLPWTVYTAGEGATAAAGGARHLGYLPPRALAHWYSLASIYVLPARYEPFGFTVLEAALSGCALVLGDISSLREIWDEAALFVPPDEFGALEESVRRLIHNPALRRDICSRAYRRALEFTPRRMAEGYAAIYRELAEGWHIRNGFLTHRSAADRKT
ncbi:MAG: glycosyltransferase family 4 protein [Syntrophales bacterium]